MNNETFYLKIIDKEDGVSTINVNDFGEVDEAKNER